MAELGLERGQVRIAPYSDAWPALYAAEVARLTPFLADAGVHLVIEHTGSTAVPGLAAKPVVDILAGLEHSRDRAAAIDAIIASGYLHRGEQGIPGRDFFRRGQPRQYHLHLTAVGSAFWHDHRAFRDWLRTHPDAMAEYMTLKQSLAARFPKDREAYIDGKAAFVAQVLRAASGEDA